MSPARKKSKKKNKRTKKRAASTSVAQRNTVAPLPRKKEMQYLSWDVIEKEEVNPLLHRHFVVGNQSMLARVLLKKGCVVPEHSHVNEQITFIAEGALKFWIDGQVIVVRAGEVLVIPANMPHKAEAVEDTVDFDVFCPPRADWIRKTDRYLR